MRTVAKKWMHRRCGNLVFLMLLSICGDIAAQNGAIKKPASADAGSPEVLAVTEKLIGAAKKEGRVHLRHGALPQATEAVAAAFKRKFGIEVVVERKLSAEGTAAFANEERAGRHIVDVHASTDRQGMLTLINEGLYARYKVSNDAQFSPKVKIENYAYVPYWSSSVLAYNTDRLKPRDAEKLFSGTWTGLLDPRFRNKRIGMLSPLATSATSLWFWALSESPKYGESFLRAVASTDPVIYPTQAVGEEALHAGEIDLLVGETADPAITAFVKGAPIAWTYPDILPANATVFHLISKNAPHPNAARLFVAWILSVDGAKSLALDAGRETSIRASIPTAPDVQSKLNASGWWKPYPEKVRFTPSIDEYLAKEGEYRKKMASMFNITVRR